MNVFSKTQLEKYADTLVWGLMTARTKPFKKYDNVLLRCDLEARELGELVHRKLVQRRFNVVVNFLPSPAIEKDFYQFSDDRQRAFLSPWDKEMYNNLNGYVFIHAPASLTHLKDIDTKRQSQVAIARKPLFAIRNKREENGQFAWTLCTYPTPELAKQARLSVKEYAAQIAKACYLNEPDPTRKWNQVYKQVTAIKKWLLGLNMDVIRTESASMDFEVTLGEKRRFLGISGHNIPSFEIFTSPDWRGTRGTYYANLPAFRGGNYVEKIRLEFKDGRAVKIAAAKGEDYVRKIMNTDKGASQLGEYSLTDRRFSKIDRFMADTLFDENHGGKHGNCHVAIGNAYTDTYTGDVSKLNEAAKKRLGYNDSAVHWDLINTEDKKVTATLKNGKKVTIYEKGQFKY
ncbi:MAG: peptidase M29 [Elusimicrobia bacterium GWA2_62_23]|nr:MAG: peptidase M29 [Elusimicrobia bacterium GWA2_62_23]